MTTGDGNGRGCDSRAARNPVLVGNSDVLPLCARRGPRQLRYRRARHPALVRQRLDRARPASRAACRARGQLAQPPAPSHLRHPRLRGRPRQRPRRCAAARGDGQRGLHRPHCGLCSSCGRCEHPPRLDRRRSRHHRRRAARPGRTRFQGDRRRARRADPLRRARRLVLADPALARRQALGRALGRVPRRVGLHRSAAQHADRHARGRRAPPRGWIPAASSATTSRRWRSAAPSGSRR